MTAERQTPVFYRNIVALSRERHKDWYVDLRQGYEFTRETNSVYVAGSEFPAVARELPIVFGRDGQGKALPVALLGLRNNTNLMIDDKGNWLGSYIPAYIRRYPFILGSADESNQNFAVCIDESYSGFNTVQEGEPLITEEGEHGELLSRTVKFLQDFHQHTQVTAAFCEAIDAAELLDSVQAKFSLKSGESFSLAGFQCVPRERLKTLPAATLKRFAEQDFLDLLYLHVYSLSNIDRLLDRFGLHSEKGPDTA
jgi:hypothetical protein